MKALAEHLHRAEAHGEFRFLLIGGRSLEAHGYVRFTEDVDFLIATSDIPAMSQRLEHLGYLKTAETAIFSRWHHPSLLLDEVDLMYVQPPIFEKLLIDAKDFCMEQITLRVPSIPSLISLKLHAIKNNPSRTSQDLNDIVQLLRHNQDVLDQSSLRALFDKYGLSQLFPLCLSLLA